MENKNRNMTKIAALFCVAALTAFSGIAYANDGGWGGEHGSHHQHHNFRNIEKKLGLTEAQKAQAKTIFQGNRDVVKPIIANLRAEHKNLQALIHADTIDEAAIRVETAKIAGIQADLNINRAKVGAQFRAILTPAQLTVLKSMHQKCQKNESATTPPTE
ncbi:MAG: Spy/CpxP family protein refolding chaperone [Desulfuromonadales bacterium]|nr:Spy/CpxP family protein refolding chaperone [Desulfuromonadales bacterium]